MSFKTPKLTGKLTTNCRVYLPTAIRRIMNVEEGSEIEFLVSEEGDKILMTPLKEH